MSPILQAANALSDAEKRLRSLVGQLTLPESDYTLAEAAEKLGGVLSKNYWHLEMKIVSCGGIEVKWEVWDGTKNYESQTLDGVVNSVLAAHIPIPDDPLKEAQLLLDKAVPLPF